MHHSMVCRALEAKSPGSGKAAALSLVLGTRARKVFCVVETCIEIVFGPVECCVPRVVQSQALEHVGMPSSFQVQTSAWKGLRVIANTCRDAGVPITSIRVVNCEGCSK